MMTRSSRFIPTALLAAVCLFAATAGGTTYQSGENVHISSLHQINDDFYATSYDIVVDGEISGDLVGACNQAEVRGKIGGSLSLFSRYLQFAGSCDHSLRWMGENMTVTGRVGGSVVAGGAYVKLRPGSVVEHDVDVYGSEVNLDGIINGRVSGQAKTIRISGQIQGDVSLEAETIILSPPATITGNLTYTTDTEDALTIEPGVTVVGEVAWQQPEIGDGEDAGILTGLAYKTASLLAAFIFGALMFAFFRTQASESLNQLSTRFPAAIAAGLAGLLGLVIAIVILVLALLGALIGSILLGGDLPVLGVAILVLSILAIPISSFVTVSGAVALYSGKIVVGLYAGHQILKLGRGKTPELSKTALFLGLVLITVLTAIPYLGNIVFALAAMIGAGAIILGVQNCRRKVGSEPIGLNDSSGESAPTND